MQEQDAYMVQLQQQLEVRILSMRSRSGGALLQSPAHLPMHLRAQASFILKPCTADISVCVVDKQMEISQNSRERITDQQRTIERQNRAMQEQDAHVAQLRQQLKVRMRGHARNNM